MVATPTYGATRDRVEAYFDGTATKTWERLTGTRRSPHPRDGARGPRPDARDHAVALPEDLTGARPRCGLRHRGDDRGTGAARGRGRGDRHLAATRRHRAEAHPRGAAWAVTFTSGDMLSAIWGPFDHVMAMDSR
jgi:magnesium-protoporphyrin O-methyltransferase